MFSGALLAERAIGTLLEYGLIAVISAANASRRCQAEIEPIGFPHPPSGLLQ